MISLENQQEMSRSPSNSYSLHILPILTALIFFSLFQSCNSSDFLPNFDLSMTPLDPIKSGFTISGNAPGDNFGASVSTTGDVNGDGFADIIIGADVKDNNKGEVYVIYGNTTSSLSDLNTLEPCLTGFKVSGNAADDHLGFSVSSAGDINGDDYDDIIIGAYGKDNKRGIAYVIYGNKTLLLSDIYLSLKVLDPSVTGFVIRGNAEGDHFGWSVSSAGDVNNDGFDDIIIGAPRKNNNRGAVYVIYGGPVSEMKNLDLSLETAGFVITGSAENDFFGSSVSSAGDVNNDGYNDIIIGAYGRNNNQGAAYVIYGGEKSSLVNIDLASSGFMIAGNAEGDHFGWSVSTAGDMNNDGFDDVVVGAFNSNNEKGAVSIIFGNMTPMTGGFVITGKMPGDHLGYSVRAAGDVNGDGYDEIIAGADVTDNNRGTAYVFYGNMTSALSDIDLGLITTGFTVIIGEASEDHFGYSVSTAGDVNNDGFDDIVVGAYTKNTAYVIHATSVNSETRNFCQNSLDFPSNSRCQSCPLNCEKFKSSPRQCEDCHKGYFLFNSTLCESCPVNCQHCSSSTFCEICDENYFLYQSQCFKSCPVATFISNDTSCKDCPKHCSSCASQGICLTCDQGYFLSNSLCILHIPLDTGAAALKTISSVATTLGGMLGSSIFSVTRLVSKIVQNTRYLDLIVTDELAQVYQNWNTQMISLEAPDMFSQQLSQFKKLPRLFSQYDLDSPFLVSFWSNLVILGVASCIFILSRAVKRYSLLEKLMIGSRNFLLVQVYGGLDDVLFYFVLDMRTNPFNKKVFPWASFICGTAFVGLGGWLIYWNILIVKRYQRVKHEAQRNIEIFNKNNKAWELFYLDFNDDNSWSQSFFALLVIRSCLSSLIITVLSDVVVMQTAFLVIMDGAILIFLIAKKPLRKFRTALAQYFFELIALFVHTCVFVLSLEGGNLRSGLCKSIVFLNKTLVFGGSGLMLLEIYQTFSEKIQAWKSNKKKKYHHQGSAAVHPVILENSITQNTVEKIDLTNEKNTDGRRRFRNHSSRHFEGSPEGRDILGNDTSQSFEKSHSVTNSSFLQQENHKKDKDIDDK